MLGPASSVKAFAKAVNFTAVAFRRTFHWRGHEVHHGFSFLGCLATRFLALIGFPVEGLRYGRGTADAAQEQDFDLEVSTLGTNVQKFSNSDLTGRLDRVMTGFDSS